MHCSAHQSRRGFPLSIVNGRLASNPESREVGKRKGEQARVESGGILTQLKLNEPGTFWAQTKNSPVNCLLSYGLLVAGGRLELPTYGL